MEIFEAKKCSHPAEINGVFINHPSQATEALNRSSVPSSESTASSLCSCFPERRTIHHDFLLHWTALVKSQCLGVQVLQHVLRRVRSDAANQMANGVWGGAGKRHFLRQIHASDSWQALSPRVEHCRDGLFSSYALIQLLHLPPPNEVTQESTLKKDITHGVALEVLGDPQTSGKSASEAEEFPAS